MKKFKVVYLFMMCSSLMLSACSTTPEKQGEEAVHHLTEEYSEEYQVVGLDESGKTIVEISAPNISLIVKDILAEEKILPYDDYDFVSYKFVINGDEIEDVKESFLTEITEHIILESMKENLTIIDTWEDN